MNAVTHAPGPDVPPAGRSRRSRRPRPPGATSRRTRASADGRSRWPSASNARPPAHVPSAMNSRRRAAIDDRREHERARQQPMPRHRSRQLEIDEARFDFVRRLGRQVDRDHRQQQAHDRVEIAEGDGALERREQHRLAAEPALQEAGQQVRHAAERLRALDLGRLPDDDELEPAQQRERSDQHVSRLRRRSQQQRDHRALSAIELRDVVLEPERIDDEIVHRQPGEGPTSGRADRARRGPIRSPRPTSHVTPASAIAARARARRRSPSRAAWRRA